MIIPIEYFKKVLRLCEIQIYNKTLLIILLTINKNKMRPTSSNDKLEIRNPNNYPIFIGHNWLQFCYETHFYGANNLLTRNA